MFTDSDTLRFLLCGNFLIQYISSLILFKCFLIVWLWDCLALCRNPSDIWWCHLKEYTKGFQGFSSLVEYGNLPNKNVWQLFWGCDGWLPLAIAQKWLRNVPWHVEYYGAIDRTKPGPFGTLWNPELYELFLRGPGPGDRSLKSWSSKVSMVVFSWSSSSACARSPPVPRRWPYSRRLPGRMVTRSEIFLSCDLGKGVSCWWNLVFYPDMMCISARRSIGTDLKCGFASHSAFCGIMNYQFVSHVIQETETSEVWVVPVPRNLKACLWSLQQMASSWPLLPPSSSVKWASLHPLIVVPIFAPRDKKLECRPSVEVGCAFQKVKRCQESRV